MINSHEPLINERELIMHAPKIKKKSFVHLYPLTENSSTMISVHAM